MRRPRAVHSAILAGAVLALGATSASATTLQTLVRLKGHEQNTLVGLGIVVGLDGTGDQSRDSLAAARPYERLLANLGNPVASIEELAEADSYALVQVSMTVPPVGVREGDRLDVEIATLFNATSLAGGTLVMSPLRVPLPGALEQPPLAFAGGPIVVDGPNPRRGLVRNGGQMITDIRTNPIAADGTVTLVLKEAYAGYPVASMIAGAVNEDFAVGEWGRIAAVEDARNVRVLVPPAHRADPAEFLALLLTIAIDPSVIQTEARVVINEDEGIILVTGDVQVGPVLITHGALSITSITPEPEPTIADPQVRMRRWAGLDTTERRAERATRLADLLQAFDQLDVPIQDQIAIVWELRKTGKLHAEIVSE